MAADNKTLGRFQLTDIPPAPRGVPQIEVTFDIDANGIVNVSARDLATNKSQKITIQSGSGLTDEEIERMVREAEENAAMDKERKEQVELLNESEHLIFTVRKAITDLGEQVSEKEKTEIEDLIAKLEKAIEEKDYKEIKKQKEALAKASEQIAIKAYQQAQSAQENKQANSQDTNSQDSDPNVVDAEYEDLN